MGDSYVEVLGVVIGRACHALAPHTSTEDAETGRSECLGRCFFVNDWNSCCALRRSARRASSWPAMGLIEALDIFSWYLENVPRLSISCWLGVLVSERGPYSKSHFLVPFASRLMSSQ